MKTNKIAIVGARGNMGKRYKAVCEHLNIDYVEFDKDDWQNVAVHKNDLHSILICSPTDTHYTLIKYYADLRKPILCEKPITKDKKELDELLGLDVKLAMVNQYEYMYEIDKSHVSSYNYFKTGGDGLEWDCINIIGLADEPPKLQNTSPIWKCVINGNRLHPGHIDESYIDMVFSWYGKTYDNKEYIKEAHNRVWGNRYAV